MVTFAQAQERAEEWINGDVPVYQHREVRVREFELGFVVWAEDREDGPTSDGGRQRLVIARDSGEASLWPGLPVGEVIRRYEEEYGVTQEASEPVAAAPERIDLNQTSFLLSPPEWLQEAADKLGIPDARRDGASAESSSSPQPGAAPAAPVAAAASPAVPSAVPSANASQAAGSSSDQSAPWEPGSSSGASWPSAGTGGPEHEPTASEGVPPRAPWADANASDDDSGSVPLPATVFAPPLSGTDDEDTPPPAVGADAPTALMSGGSQLPRTAVAPALRPDAPAPAAPVAPAAPGDPFAAPGAGATPPPARDPFATPAGGPADIADAATSKAALPPTGGRGTGATTPPPPAPPGVPGAPGGGGVQHAATMLAHPGPGGPAGPGAPPPPAPPAPPAAPGAPGAPGGGVHHAATMLAHPGQMGPGTPPPPAPPGVPGAPGGGDVQHAATMLAHPGPGGPAGPGAPPPPAPPGAPGGGMQHAATMLAHPGQMGPGTPPPPAPAPAPAPAPGPGPVPGPGPGPAYGYPQQSMGQPTVGPGYQAVLRYRAPDGSEQQLIRRSAPGTPHPEWQIFHELRAMNIPPDQVLELHTELESCELPGGYCARMIRETWPQARITSIAPYGRDHAGRQQGMRQLLTHQGELHQVADGPARPAPVRAPLPQVQPAPPVPPEAIAQELAGAFGPGICRFDQRAVSRQGVPEMVARTLVWAGLPADFGPFFWAQPAQPVVPTLAELAAQRQVQPAADAGSYLVVGSDFGRAICVQYGTAHIVAVPVEAGPGGQPVAPQFVNSGLPEFTRSMALLGRMWRLRFGLNPEQAGRWTVDFQAQLAMVDPAALASPESWWSVLLEQMWDGLL
ncbi:SUKH-4 family immunity protein [Streptomyces purpureus]|uniref:Nucleic acid/nucleotide deaminase of polymorphic system toxin n=1 Tax=Streptomyces purpureus TaxID=1951 RepID=A0A918H3U7_9ACTN|nr:SUKH-4 family immunity protein [Streptomyces purpureus]GGT34812.1 hypothetical protein GCM10014713_30550 [Streptomyces purpureus]